MNKFLGVIYKTVRELVIEGYKEVKFTISETKRLRKQKQKNEG